LSRLPDKYRIPVVLCELEGKAIKEVALQLGWAQGIVASRLARARALLAKRLTRRGLAISGVTLGGVLAQHSARASVPNPLLAATIRAACLLAAGRKLSESVISTKVVPLVEKMMKTMLIRKLGVAGTLLLLLAVAGTQSSLPLRSAQGQVPAIEWAALPSAAKAKRAAKAPAEAGAWQTALRRQLETMTWMLAQVDVEKATINVDDRRELHDKQELIVIGTPSGVAASGLALSRLKISPTTSILLDGKPAILGELKPGMRVSLRWAENGHSIARIDATSALPIFSYRLDEIDLASNTLSVTVQQTQMKLQKVAVSRDAAISTLALTKEGTLRSRPCKFSDLRAGMWVSLDLMANDGAGLVIKTIIAAN
jgi:hypothetical protein